MRSPICAGGMGLACILAGGGLRAADVPRPAAPPPFASVVALAAARHIPLQGIDPARDPQELRPGDALTVLFTLFEQGHAQQWLAEITVVPLTAEERRAQPREDVVYTSTGRDYRLASAPAAFALRMFGPFRDAAVPTRPDGVVPEKHARFLVQQDFLSFGFDHYCEMILRLRAIGQEPRLGVTTGRWPEKDIVWSKQWAEKAGFTAQDELICVKQAFAVLEFLKIAQHTPGLREIAEATVRLPSAWTVLRTWKFGCSFDFDFKNVQRSDGTPYGVESSSVYALPFGLTMSGKHVANGTWRVAAARPPLLASAGVLALTVGPPDNRERFLELRVIAARNAPP